ncbi:MAG: hypothetical protein ACOH2B_09690 [Burkholderiaceae bacterium]
MNFKKWSDLLEDKLLLHRSVAVLCIHYPLCVSLIISKCHDCGQTYLRDYQRQIARAEYTGLQGRLLVQKSMQNKAMARSTLRK